MLHSSGATTTVVFGIRAVVRRERAIRVRGGGSWIVTMAIARSWLGMVGSWCAQRLLGALRAEQRT